mmetsp:Transcript_57281/g.63973  ORF Transcript_57281/g.63973 Transcript_57281/m.63973 type:complete len:112 (+) Transcript_57281:30-365(+)
MSTSTIATNETDQTEQPSRTQPTTTPNSEEEEEVEQLDTVDMLEQLVELFIEKNGREPNQEEIQQWIDVFKTLNTSEEKCENDSTSDNTKLTSVEGEKEEEETYTRQVAAE